MSGASQEAHLRLARSLLAAGSVSEVFLAAAQHAADVLGASAVVLFQLEDDGRVSFARAEGIDSGLVRDVLRAPGAAALLAGWLEDEPRPIAIPSVAEIPGMDAAAAIALGLHHALALPLAAAERAAGLMILVFRAGANDAAATSAGPLIAADIGSALARARNAERLAHAAMTDSLTGLANVRTFRDAIARHMSIAQRTGRPFAIALADIDNLKRVNDTLGHAAGDALIQTVGRALAGAIRAGDLVARLGGDEFGIILPDADAAGAGEAASRIAASVAAAEIDWAGRALRCSVSLGAASFPEEAADVETLQALADSRLYGMKSQDRG